MQSCSFTLVFIVAIVSVQKILKYFRKEDRLVNEAIFVSKQLLKKENIGQTRYYFDPGFKMSNFIDAKVHFRLFHSFQFSMQEITLDANPMKEILSLKKVNLSR